ncbi:MAG TPA: DUF4258 domain-containing protein [Blastocatellia bacterium]|nr:DUF4258 domain-containing protein [Blastocatellia bacterium]
MIKAIEIERVRISRHAGQRLAQRGISLEDVHLVLRLGQKLHRTGVTFFFFGRRQIPRGLERELERLVGTTLLVSNGCLITAYRNKRAIAAIKKKLKRRHPVAAPSGAEIIPWPGVPHPLLKEPSRDRSCAA